MVLQEALQASYNLFLCPLLFYITVINVIPNPARFVMNRMVQEGGHAQDGAAPHERRICMPLAETSHEAFDWAVHNFLRPGKDFVHVLYVPEGMSGRAYKQPMKFNRSNYYQVLQGVDFLWEYCQNLDMANIDFECLVIPPSPGSNVFMTILSKAKVLKPDIILMGASKRAGPDDIGPTAYHVSSQSTIPVVVVK